MITIFVLALCFGDGTYVDESKSFEETRATQERNVETNQGTSVPSEPRADTSFVHWKFVPLIDLTYEKLKELEEMECVLYISKCSAESQVEFATCMLQSRALTWWNTLVYTKGRAIAIAQPWEDLKKLLMEKYCPGNAIKELKEEFWDHVMIGADVDKYTTRFYDLARLVSRTDTPESKRIDRYIPGLAPAIRRTIETSPC
ncbi:putative reverse transcriptase domain-containing protein [Tanacetum coccineum]